MCDKKELEVKSASKARNNAITEIYTFRNRGDKGSIVVVLFDEAVKAMKKSCPKEGMTPEEIFKKVIDSVKDGLTEKEIKKIKLEHVKEVLKNDEPKTDKKYYFTKQKGGKYTIITVVV